MPDQPVQLHSMCVLCLSHNGVREAEQMVHWCTGMYLLIHDALCLWYTVCVVPPSPVQCLLVWCVPEEGDAQLLALPGVHTRLALHAVRGGDGAHDSGRFSRGSRPCNTNILLVTPCMCVAALLLHALLHGLIRVCCQRGCLLSVEVWAERITYEHTRPRLCCPCS
jgi:hypothetical protein